MPFVRGSNPVWLFDDLTGHLLDDQFYMFVLSNEIPYGPLPIYQDPFGNVEWTNPLQFYANGTLPNNVYFDPDTVYRIEIRQGDSQSDALIYLVENYVPGSSGNTPINESSFSTDNQVSNPQFALLNLVSPFVLNSISTQVIKVAPDWFLHLTGSGNVTLTQVLLNSAVIDPTNASYALQIQLSGSWTNAYLSQRFNRNGVLWSNTFVSSSITALSGNAPQNISAILVDSQGNTLTTVLNSTPLTEVFNEYQGVGQIGSSVDTDFPPTAYIEYQLSLPNNCNVTLTSVQLISGDVNIAYPYEQKTIERQIDQTYHDAYPIIPVGGVIDYAGYTNPAHFFLCDGTAYSRTTYQMLLSALTMQQSIALIASTNTFTMTNASILLYVGIPLEGTGIPSGTTVTALSGTTVTISNNATVTGIQILTFFPWGNGDGASTFNVPGLLGYVTAGAQGSIFPNNGLGAKGGAATHAITINEMPAHNHPGSVVTPLGTSTVVAPPGGNAGAQLLSGSTAVTVAQQGGGTLNVSGAPMSLLQPTALMRKFIRYE